MSPILFNHKSVILRILLCFILLQFLFIRQTTAKENIEKDSANLIMQKAIAQAYNYRNLSLYFQTKTFYEATFKIDKISRLFNAILTTSDEPPLKNGNILVQEKIIKTNRIADSAELIPFLPVNSFPKKIESFELERLILYDIYSDTCRFISPLSPEALRIYQFRLEKTFSNSSGEKIFRIRVIPKHKNPYTFFGYIDIADSAWQIHTFHLSANMNYGVASFAFTIEEHFRKNENGIFLPDTCFVSGKMKTMGLKADVQIFASFSIEPENGISRKDPENNQFPDEPQNRYRYGFKYLDEILTLNPVDGFKVKLGGYFDWEFKNQTVWHNSATVGYSFAQKQVPFFVSTGYEYLPEKRAAFFVFGGKENVDFNCIYGVHPVLNLMATLFVKDNYNYLYDRTHVGIEHRMEIFNGFDTKVSFSYERRAELYNKNDYSFFYRKTKLYPPNIPANPYVSNTPELIEGGNAALLEVELSYTPQRDFRFEKRKKIFLYSNFPAFSVLWRKGIANFFKSSTNFDYLQFSVHQKIKKNIMRNFTYRFSAGWFPNNKKMHFSEFRHFPVSGFTETLGGFGEMYHTLPIYAPSTNEWMLSGFFKYETLYLAIKYIPWINKTHLTESLYFSYLNTPYTRNLIEIGYSLNNILLFVNAGFFVGFENFRYLGWSFKIAFSMPEI